MLNLFAALLALGIPGARPRPRPQPVAPPAIRHVFVIVLENQAYESTFGADSPAPYLADTLVRAGAFLRQYYGIGHASLDNYVAMVSGIAPNRNTQGDCGRYVEFVQTGTASDGQPIGSGCVYPAAVPTIADQLASHGLTWKAYMEDMGKDPSRETATCAHAPIGDADHTERATPSDQYAAKHNPFVYFHSIIDAPVCQTNVVPLSALTGDLRSTATIPNYAFIAPNLCHDGHDKPCRNGEPGGLVSADRFLAEWVPRIMHTPAYRDGGLIIITFDEAQSGHKEACCNEPTGPNTNSPGAGGPGGGRTGTVLLSPFIGPGTVSDVPYNHYSMLRSVEDIFGLPHLGYAGQQGLVPFGDDVYDGSTSFRPTSSSSLSALLDVALPARNR
jgi:phosphatidylinositol-3-phosphatase